MSKNIFFRVRKFLWVTMAAICFGPLVANTAELNDVKAADEITVDGKKLVLNGMGLRKVTKLGFPIKVYIGELYVENKSKDTDAILSSESPKVLIMHFLLGLDRNQLIEAFQQGFENGCYIACDRRNDQWQLLAPHIVSMRRGNELKFVFYKDKLELSSDRPGTEKVVIATPVEMATALSHNILSMFINAKRPPTEEFRRGLLGL